jgi:hypothetical protein
MSVYDYDYGRRDDCPPAFQSEPVICGKPLTVREFNELVERAIERGNRRGVQHPKKPLKKGRWASAHFGRH